MGKSTSQGTVLVTGASGGIGEATSLYLARRGYRVLATSRELSRLGDLVERAGAESLPISGHQLDINDPLSVRDVVPGLISDAGPLRALVNNAGYGLLGFLEDLRVEELRSLFETNLFAVHRMTQAVLPHMRHRGQGTIVNVGSIAGQVGTPAGGAYAASKYALRGLTRVLRMEVARFGVQVVLIEPGLFRTNFHQSRALGEQTLDPGSPYYKWFLHIRANSEANQRWAGDPSRVARTIATAIKSRRPRARYPVGLDARLVTLATMLLPDSLLDYLVARVSLR